MSEQPTTPTAEQPAVFPEGRVRRLYPAWEDQKRIQEAFSSWPAQEQADFARMVAGGHDAELPRQIDAFVNDAPAEDQPGDDGIGDEGPDAEIEEALATVDTAEAYARANPERIGDLLQAERDRPKPRKTLVEELERLQRAHQRENEE
jgi:hypothetical protein